ncbi:hypothetical protein ACX0G7_11435 [Flavitalea antarctica]
MGNIAYQLQSGLNEHNQALEYTISFLSLPSDSAWLKQQRKSAQQKALLVGQHIMTPLGKLIFSTLPILCMGCGNSSTNAAAGGKPLIAKDTTSEIERKNTLFVFVGERIETASIPHKPGDFDNGVRAKYRILQPVYGNYKKDVIEFEAYDHYGTPEFIKYKTVLLFVSEYKGKFYQEKYMFDPLAKTKDGRWAGPYSSEYAHPYNKHTTVKPEKVDFVEQIFFPTRIKNNDGKEFTLTYQEPYFKTVGDSAIAVYGNYIPELFKLKKEGVLTARELFPGKSEKEAELEKTTDAIDDY